MTQFPENGSKRPDNPLALTAGDFLHAQDLYLLIDRLNAYETAMGELRLRGPEYAQTLDMLSTLSIPTGDNRHLSLDFFFSDYDSSMQKRMMEYIRDINEEEGYDDYEEWCKTYPLIDGMRNSFLQHSVGVYVNIHRRNPETNLIHYSEDAMILAHHKLISYEPYSVMMTAVRLVILKEYALSKLMEDDTEGMLQ